MSDTISTLLFIVALLMAVGPAAVGVSKLIREKLESGPVPMTYRDADGLERTETVDPSSVESIEKFLSGIRGHTREPVDVK